MSDMPTLGRSRKRPAGPAFVVVALVILIALFAWWLLRKKPAAPVATVPAPPPTAAPGNPPPPAPVAAAVNDDGGVGEVAAPKPQRSLADAELEKAGLKRLRVEVNGPLETAVV